MKFRWLPFFLLALAPLHAFAEIPGEPLPAAALPAVSGLRVSNNYDFPIREKISFRLKPELAAEDANLLAVSHSVVGGTVEAHYLPVQIAPDTGAETPVAWIDVQLRPNESRQYTFQSLGKASNNNARPEVAAHHPNGLPHRITLPSGTTTEIFDLSLIEIPGNPKNLSSDRIRKSLANTTSGSFQLIDQSHGPVLSTYLYRGEFAGENAFHAEIRYDILPTGVTEIDIRLQPRKLSPKAAYLALAKSFPISESETASVRRHGKIESLADAPETNIRWLALQNEAETTIRAILGNGQLPERALAHENRCWMLTEIVFSETEETIALSFKILPAKEQDLTTVDQAFAAFAGYRGHSIAEEELTVDFGVEAVSFGALFSHTENRPQIERDFRIANAIGLEWLRIEGNEFLENPDSLAPFAETAEETGLQLLLPIPADPAAARTIAERFGNAIRLYEIDPADSAPDAVEKTRNAILSVQPDAAVFPKSAHLPIPDSAAKILAQTFTPELTADPGKVRDAALALGGFSSIQGKTPLISQFAWTAQDADSETEIANQFFQDHQNLLQQHGARIVFLSEFSETETPSATAPIRLDGTPKPQAQALYELIQRHSSGDSRNKRIDVKMPLIRISPNRTVTLPVTITNKGNQPVEIQTRPLLPDGLTADSETESFTLRPRESRTIRRSISAGSDLEPGAHHIFEEIRFHDTVRLGWTYATFRETR